MSYQEAKELLSKYEAGICTDAEKAVVEKWLFQVNNESAEWSDERLSEIRNEVWQRLPQSNTRRVNWLPRMAAAASILLFLSAGVYFYYRQYASQHVIARHDILPGHNQATLTLASGKKIVLTKDLTGELAEQGQTVIKANGTSGITYTTANPASKAPVTYNTLTTAKGEQSPYPLILADGTKVWLNAESSVTFPTAFEGTERLVKMTGEVYFEVAHNARQPFLVTVKNQTIEDIGTQFNISAYNDEPLMKTTLVEGSVKVLNKHGDSRILKPGQQSISDDKGMEVRDVEPSYEVAWKEGFFMFNNDNLESIMNRVARWYNVQVVFKDQSLRSRSFIGTISRFEKISKVLDMLQRTDAAIFEIDHNTIIIKKK